MRAGFEVFGTHGALQISESTPTMMLRHTGVVQTLPLRAPQAFTLPCEMGHPVLAIRPLYDEAVAIFNEDRGVGTVTYRAVSNLVTAFQYYLYDRCQNVLPPGGGLVVYGADGGVIFSSEQRPMRIVATAQVTDSSLRDDYQPATITGGDAGRSYACALLNPKRYFFNPARESTGPLLGAPAARHVEGVKALGGNSFITTQQLAGGSGVVGTSRSPGVMLMVDVTGF